jgi:hypothetical protein
MDKIEQQIINYMRTHWPSEVRPEWQVTDQMYPKILSNIITDFTKNATKSHRFFRIAGQSGSGKTSQLLPGVKAYYAKLDLRPILVAARLFVPYHPFAKEIKNEYGPQNLRTKTNEFSTITMFLVLKTLIASGYDIILDVTLLDPIVEAALMQMLTSQNYATRCTLVAVSKEISDQFIGKRQGRKVAPATATEFWRATTLALAYYAKNHAEMPITIWSAWDLHPIYNGPIGAKTALKTIEKYHKIPTIPPNPPTPDQLLHSKITYFQSI